MYLCLYLNTCKHIPMFYRNKTVHRFRCTNYTIHLSFPCCDISPEILQVVESNLRGPHPGFQRPVGWALSCLTILTIWLSRSQTFFGPVCFLACVRPLHSIHFLEFNWLWPCFTFDTFESFRYHTQVVDIPCNACRQQESCMKVKGLAWPGWRLMNNMHEYWWTPTFCIYLHYLALI